MNGTTDTNGIVEFRLPADSYKFRADYRGNQYWSTAGITADVVNAVEISAGGGQFLLTVTTGAGPLSGQRVYLFSAAGSYLGVYGVTNSNGEIALPLADGSYKFRVDYLGYQYWTANYTVPAALSDTFSIEHRNVTILVNGFYQETQPIKGLNVYLFTPAGSYVGKYLTTGDSGQVSFNLPNNEYKVRVDYLGRQYWSDVFRWTDKDVTIGEGLVSVQGLRGGSGVAGVKVYLFNTGGAYLGRFETTNAGGKATFIIPAGSYQFRVDYNGKQQWSPTVNVTAGEAGNVVVSLDE